MAVAGTHRKRVVVVGGGFGGLSAARAFGDDVDVTLVSRSEQFEYTPGIHELVSQSRSARTLVLPVREVIEQRGARFVRDEVVGLDARRRVVECASGARLAYDALVLAPGSEAWVGVPGAREHARALRTVRDGAWIGDRLRALARRREACDVVIVGGGYTGLEVLGEVLRRYRRTRRVRVHLVEAAAHLLGGVAPKAEALLRRLCEPHGVAFYTSAPVARVERDEVVLASGASIPSDLTIWTAGIAPPELLEEARVASRPGAWADVAPTLESAAARGVFVVGDAAALEQPIARQAYHALDMGAHAARNIERWLAGEELAAFRPSHKPLAVSFGDLTTLLLTENRVVASPALAPAKTAAHALTMARLGRAAQRGGIAGVAGTLAAGVRWMARPALESIGALGSVGDVHVFERA